VKTDIKIRTFRCPTVYIRAIPFPLKSVWGRKFPDPWLFFRDPQPDFCCLQPPTFLTQFDPLNQLFFPNFSPPTCFTPIIPPQPALETPQPTLWDPPNFLSMFTYYLVSRSPQHFDPFFPPILTPWPVFPGFYPPTNLLPRHPTFLTPNPVLLRPPTFCNFSDPDSFGGFSSPTF